MTNRMAREHAMIFAQCTEALIKMEAMKAANAEREARGEAQTYPKDAFLALIEEHNLGWNNVVGALNSAMD